MNLKKLIPELVTGLNELGYAEKPMAIQTTSLPQIKSGADLFIVSPEKKGKSTAILIGVIQQLKDAFEEAPRAIIMTATKEKAFEMEEEFDKMAKHTELRSFAVFDKGDVQYQKDMIFEGLDVLIGTPKRLNELIKLNGVRLNKVKMFIVDDIDTYRVDKYPLIYQVADSIERSQFIMVTKAWDNKFNKISERIMKSPRMVK